MPALFTGASSSPAIDLSASSLPPGTRLSPPVAVTAGTRVCAPKRVRMVRELCETRYGCAFWQ